MFDPAASPEGGGGGAVADCRCRHAPADGRSCSARGGGCEVYECGNRGISGRRTEEFLFSGDEYAVAGGASGDGTGDGARSGTPADSYRCRGEVAVYAERRTDSRAR